MTPDTPLYSLTCLPASPAIYNLVLIKSIGWIKLTTMTAAVPPHHMFLNKFIDGESFFFVDIFKIILN